MLGSKQLFYEMPWANREKLTVMLKELEWSCIGGDYRGYCHVCSEPQDKGHDPNCQLKAIIDVWNNEPD